MRDTVAMVQPGPEVISSKRARIRLKMFWVTAALVRLASRPTGLPPEPEDLPPFFLGGVRPRTQLEEPEPVSSRAASRSARVRPGRLDEIRPLRWTASAAAPSRE